MIESIKPFTPPVSLAIINDKGIEFVVMIYSDEK